MSDATIGTELSRQESLPDSGSDRLPNTVRTIASFVLVLVVLILLYQVIKAVFQIDDRTLPNIPDIIATLFRSDRPDQPILAIVLLNAGLFTVREAILGFAFGATFGFALAVIFAHSRLLQRGLMPFVVASQTVPILAVAPIVVVWLKAGWISVAVISAYLTFFPVVIYSLRGLLSVPVTALELMRSYAANRRDILIKLRIPNALPYIFAALKVSATASIVGAIIGELPSGIQDGLAYYILYYNQYYIQGPTRLWATNIIAAVIGISAFVIVTIVERLIVRWTPAR